ncbi:FKBP-type peptidyl-prolyl cis-trans isomerase N-terminal domain-containing protein [Litoribrevibacter albus]|uniref:Peptidyl-prolyl cis-trans isomerase n=1 Tax=Litoribrevibacter albus TaxID=1473156 RepID=A0AA37W7T5_9GAMM|nr:FKBP-type peptidyl-prolyl cis-trans isomerase N-terminal domain-containing protein [Litoribrevibacter albus]GLQ33115.1 outer membrane protein MIP [Litoribrevibacter albus]
MKVVKNLVASAALTLSVGGIAAESDVQPVAMTDQQKLSYAIGVVFGARLQQETNQLDMTVFEQGLRDSYQGQPLKLSDQQIKDAFERYRLSQEAARKDQEAAFEQLAQANFERGQKFLKENLKSSSVQEIEPGLQFEVVKEGTGAHPGLEDTVAVHYQGQLLNGDVFDTSRQLEKPVQFQVKQAPASWVKILPKMSVGSVWRVWVSPELGFGSGGAGPVGPNEVLEYELELVAVNP